MRESLLTIPINEVFEPKTGCPVCNMRGTVETHIAEYIMGAAMMEPDVRMDTNALGFCRPHFGLLMKQNNRLSLGLMLDSYLGEFLKDTFKSKKLFGKNTKEKRLSGVSSSCFICSKTDWGINHMLKTFFVMFGQDVKFRALFSEQEFICLPHSRMLMSKAEKALSASDRINLKNIINELTGNYRKKLLELPVNDENYNDFLVSAGSFITGRKPEQT